MMRPMDYRRPQKPGASADNLEPTIFTVLYIINTCTVGIIDYFLDLQPCVVDPQTISTMSTDLKNLVTPSKCTADFCLIPIGTPTASVSAQIADVQRLMKKSGLKYSMHSAGTTVGKCGLLHVPGSVKQPRHWVCGPSTSGRCW